MARNPKTHRHPFVIPKKPPIIGPRTGPRKGAEAKRLIAMPRCLAGNMSAITPPALVRGDDPNDPARKRRIMRVHAFFEPHIPALKAVRRA
jgi:hypothetical protein